jgi:hypothetical protein
MAKTAIVLLFSLLTLKMNAQAFQDSLAVYFSEVKTTCEGNQKFWERNLYGAILLVDPRSRQVFANEPDSSHHLLKDKDIYAGVLPSNVNIANTAINWNGKQWAMIMLPLPKNQYERINLIVHELFHREQRSLGFIFNNTDNDHLDKKEGRIYLRLELEALKKAVLATSKKEQQQHITNALIFRKYRHTLFVGAAAAENQLELNEGIAEFTGLMFSNRDKKQVSAHLVDNIEKFFTNKTFVRSFAYYTIPVYGYVLYSSKNNWNKEITSETDLTNYFARQFNIQLPSDLQTLVVDAAKPYNVQNIFKEEEKRDEENKKLVTEYKNKFILQPHFEIRFEKMNISFDPGNIIPIEGKGSVYPTIRVTDNWGILTVENGALLSSGWDKIFITIPINITGNKAYGDGWVLELTEDYKIEEQSNKNYKLTGNHK